jgi:hypothetical protein
MSVQLLIHYEQLLELVEQLSAEEQNDLIRRLLQRQSRQRPLTIEEKLQLLDAVKLDVAINEEPSIRRENWYGDDGR